MEEALNKAKNINLDYLDDIQKKLSTYSTSISKFMVFKFFVIILILVFVFSKIYKYIAPLFMCLIKEERDDELSLSQQFEYEQENKRKLFGQDEEEDLEYCDQPTLVYAGSFPA